MTSRTTSLIRFDLLRRRTTRRQRLASLAARVQGGQFDVLTPEVIARLRSARSQNT